MEGPVAPASLSKSRESRSGGLLSAGVGWKAVGISLIASFVALVLRRGGDPFLGNAYPLVFAFGAVAISAAVGGWVLAVPFAVFNFLLVEYFILPPRGSLELFSKPDELAAFGSFCFTSAIIVALAEGRRRAYFRANERSEELAVEKERLRVTLASIGDGVVCTDSTGRLTFLNGVAQQLTGWSSEEAMGKRLQEVFRIVNEETRETVANPVERVLADGKVVGLANHTILLARDGRETSIADSAAPIRNSAGEIEGVVLAFRDVSEDRRAERNAVRSAERMALLSETLQGLLAARDPEKIVDELCPKVAAHIGADVFFNFMVKKDGCGLRLHAAQGLSQETFESFKEIEFGQSLCGVAAQTLREIVETDVQTSSSEHARGVRSMGVQAYACNPLQAGGRLLGTLSFASRSRRRFDEDELDFIRTVSQHVALSLERLFGEEQMRQREGTLAEQARLLDLSSDAIIVCNLEDRIQYWNQGAERLYGWSRSEAVGQVKSQMLHTEATVPLPEVMQELLQKDRWEGELTHVRRDGQRMIANTRWTLDRDAAGKPCRILKNDNDITARKLAEERLRRSEDQLAHATRIAGFGVFEQSHRDGALYLSARMREIHGLSAGQSVTMADLHAQVHPEERAELEAAYRESLDPAGDGIFSRESRIVPDGDEVRYIVSRSQTFFEGEGAARRPVRTIGAELDVTDRKRAEEALRASKQELSLIYSHVSDVIFDLGVEGEGQYRFRSVNQAFLDATGLNEEAVVGRLVSDVIPEPSLSIVLGNYRRAIDERKSVRWEETSQYPSGVRTGVVAVTPLFNEAGVCTNLIGTVHDITERTVAEAALRRSERRLRMVTDHMPELVSFIDRNLVYQFVNAAYAEWFGADPGTLVGRPVDTLLSPEAFGERRESMLAALRGENVRFEAWTPHRRHGRRLTELVYVPERTGEGSVDGFYVFAHDITERMVAQRTLEETARALREADRRKDEFLAMLAHELRNPLASVSNAVALLKAPSDELTRLWAVDVVQRQSVQLARLIDDLFDVSRITSGKIQLRKILLDVGVIVRRVVEDVQPMISERRHTLSFSPEPKPWEFPVEADPTRLGQIVMNLLSNAAKYTDVGGTIRVEMRREHSPEGVDSVVIRVQDNGLGIAPEKISEMFELFAQGERSIARSEGGLGVGLTIVRKLTELHGGQVHATSAGPGTGSTFEVWLPAALAAAPAEKTPPESSPADATDASAGMRVVVVDDNADTAVALARLLKLSGFEVETAHNGPDALRLAEAFKPDYLLLDIGLPGMDGYEVCERIRNGTACPEAVIIAISGYSHEEDRNRSRQAGFDHHLVKPVDFDELRTLLRVHRNGRAG